MDKIRIQVGGEGFSPKKLKKLIDLPITILSESRELGLSGKYRGKLSPYGLCYIVTDQYDVMDVITRIADNFEPFIDGLKEIEIKIINEQWEEEH
jgi:hypothetical protein